MSETLLHYELIPHQLDATEGTEATLVIMAALKPGKHRHHHLRRGSNPGRHKAPKPGEREVLVEKITVVVEMAPGSTQGKDSNYLSSKWGNQNTGYTFEYQASQGWTYQPETEGVQTQGKMVARPISSADASLGPSSVVLLTLSKVAMDTGEGIARVNIHEVASAPNASPAQAKKTRVDSLILNKVKEFSPGTLRASHHIIDHGGEVTLSWVGSVGAMRTLEWEGCSVEIDKKEVQSPVSVAPVGSCRAYGLHQHSTTFYMQVEHDEENTEIRCPVTVRPLEPKIEFSATPQINGELLLEWETEGVTQVWISCFKGDFQANIKHSEILTPTAGEPLPLSVTLTANTSDPDVSLQRTLEWTYVELKRLEYSTPVVVSPDASRVFVRRVGEESITALEGQSLKITGTADVGMMATDMAVSAKPRRVFLAKYTKPNIKVLDASSLHPVGEIQFDKSADVQSLLVANNRLFAANFTKIYVFDTHSLKPVAGSPIGFDDLFITSLELSPDAQQLFVVGTMMGSGNTGISVYVIDTQTLKILGPAFQFGDGRSYENNCIAVSNKQVYISLYSYGSLLILDRKGNTLELATDSPVEVGNNPGDVSVSLDGSRIFVTHAADNKLLILDTHSLKVVKELILADKFVNSLVFSPDGRRLYIGFYDKYNPFVSVLAESFVPKERA